jgi:hypothetical protein
MMSEARVIFFTFHLLRCAVYSKLAVAMERYNVKTWAIDVSGRRAIAAKPESVPSSQIEAWELSSKAHHLVPA